MRDRLDGVRGEHFLCRMTTLTATVLQIHPDVMGNKEQVARRDAPESVLRVECAQK